MRSLIFLLITSFEIAAWAQSADEPKQLTSLRESYTKARTAATAPIDKKYVEALNAMKLQLTKAGSLQGALAVDAEITRISGLSVPTTATTSEKEAITPQWLTSITITRGTGVYWFTEPNLILYQKQEDQKRNVPPKQWEYRITSANSIEFGTGETLAFTFDKNRKKTQYVSPQSSESCEVSKAKK